MEKIKRPLIAHFLDTSQASAYADAEWARLGINVTEASVEYNPQSETNQDIVSDSASTDLTGYQPTMPVSQQCTKGDPVFGLITKLRRMRATMGDSYSWLLNVDLWDKTGDGASAVYAAEVQRVSIQVDTYGGTGGEAPTQEYTLNFVGDPTPGTVSMADGAPSFTAGAAAEPAVLLAGREEV